MSAMRLLESIVRTMKKQLADHTAEHEAVCLQLAASKDAYDELESRHNDTLADLATVQGERDALLATLAAISVMAAFPYSQNSIGHISKAALAQPAAPSEVKE